MLLPRLIFFSSPNTCQEAEKVASVFEQVAPDLVKFDSPCDIMKGLAEVIKVSDIEFISLELHRLLRR